LDIYPCAKFHCNILRGVFPKYVKYYAFVTFVVLSCSGYTFFSRNSAQVEPLDGFLTIYGFNDASSPKDVPFGGLDDDTQY